MGEGQPRKVCEIWDLRVISDEKEDFVRMNPTCCDECVEEVSNGVSGLEMEDVLVAEKWCGGVIEEGDGGDGVNMLMRRCFVGVTDRYFNVSDVGEAGVS